MTESRKLILLGSSIALIALLYFLSPVLMPFITAAILAYLTDPIVNRLVKLRLPRTLAVTIVFLLLLLVIFLLFFFLIPLLEKQILLLVHKMPQIIAWIQMEVMPWLQQHFDIQWELNIDTVKKTLTANWQQTGNAVGYFMTAITHSGLAILSGITNFILIPVVLFYLLRDWDGFLIGAQKLLPRRIEPTVTRLLKECDEVLSAFLRGQLLVMISLGILYATGLGLVGLDLALLIGIIGGIVSIVPYLGFIVGVLSAGIAAYFQFHDLIHIIYVFIVFMIAQGIEGMVLTPLLVGDKIGLHPVAVIFAILAGGQLFGFVGILLALPVAAVIMVFVRYFCAHYISSDLYQQPTNQVITQGKGKS